VTKRSIEQRAETRRPAGRKKPARATLATARKVAGFAYDKKAVDLLVMDLRKVTDMTSFFIVCTGESGPQVKAVADNVLEKARKAGMEIYNVEGYEALRWILIDMIDIVVHIFQPEVRRYYQLERLWGDAPVERIGAGEAGSGD
jgi:ribosome-associated protein